MTQTVKLPTDVSVTIDPTLIHQVAVAEAANARAPHGHTKTRGEVRGGGKKPWRQKGTGRARASSIRSPIWVGGGITFGPRANRNFTVRVNRPMRRRAFAAVVANLIQAGRIHVLPAVSDATTTKVVLAALKDLPNLGRRPLLLTTETHSARGWRNLAGVTIAQPSSVTTRALLSATAAVVTPDSLAVFYRRAFGTDGQPDSMTVRQQDSHPANRRGIPQRRDRTIRQADSMTEGSVAGEVQ